MDPREEYCQDCSHFPTERCELMIPPATAALRLLEACLMDLEEKIQLVVKRQVFKANAHEHAVVLAFEVKRSFTNMSEGSFGAPEGGARLIMALLRGLAYRQFADIMRQEYGRKRASSCQWFKGIPGKGSFCNKETPPLQLDAPHKCPTLDCFAPIQEVAMEESESPVTPPSQDGIIEQQHIHEQLQVFLRKSPVMCELFRTFTMAENAEIGALKKTWAERFSVSGRTIENWRNRAQTLFMSLYTGAYEQLAKESQRADLHHIVTARDFNPAHPLPSSLLPLGAIAKERGWNRKETVARHEEAWLWMRDWMLDNGYPQAAQLQLPIASPTTSART